MWVRNNKEEWYAIFVLTGEEDNVKERLKYLFKDKFRIFIPKRKLRERKKGSWRYVIRTLFPGYVLVNGSIGINEYYSIKDIPGIIKLLRADDGPLRIDENELEVLNRLTCNNEIIGTSSIFYKDGLVKVIDGPLLSCEGLIESVNTRKGRAKVRLDFLGQERIVELSVSIIKPIE